LRQRQLRSRRNVNRRSPPLTIFDQGLIARTDSFVGAGRAWTERRAFKLSRAVPLARSI
jgi:hypothetical protein